MMEELLLKTQEKSVGRAIVIQRGSHTVTFGHSNCGFQAGVVNGAVSGPTFRKKRGSCP